MIIKLYSQSCIEENLVLKCKFLIIQVLNTGTRKDLCMHVKDCLYIYVCVYICSQQIEDPFLILFVFVYFVPHHVILLIPGSIMCDLLLIAKIFPFLVVHSCAICLKEAVFFIFYFIASERCRLGIWSFQFNSTLLLAHGPRLSYGDMIWI